MKKIKLFWTIAVTTAMICAPMKLNAQVTIGSVNAPATFALLELCTSTAKSGLRLPQLNATEAANIRAKVADIMANGTDAEKNRAEGLMFYNLYTNCVEYWNGKIWRYLCGEESEDALRERIKELTQEITELETRIHHLENFTKVSETLNFVGRTNFPNYTADNQNIVRRGILWASGDTGYGRASGGGVSLISNGFTYIFWGIGSFQSTVNLEARRYYLLISGSEDNPALGISEALSWYQGAPTIGTAWVHNPQGGGAFEALPLFFDTTGIYLNPTSSKNWAAGTTIQFTQALLLVDPDIVINGDNGNGNP